MTRSVPRTARRLAGALAAALVGTLVAVPAPSAVAGEDDLGLVPVRIGTYNIRADRTLAQFKRGIDKLKPRVDVLGLQEITHADKNDYLIDDEAWGYYRPAELRQNPVVWRRSVFQYVDSPTTGHRIATGGVVEAKTGGTETKGDTYATVVRLRHLLTGNVLSVVNVHLLSGASRMAEPYPGRPRRYAMLKDQIRGLIRLVKAERELGHEVYPVGDFNVGFVADQRVHRKAMPFRRFKRIGFKSMWHDAERTDQGTFGPVYLDQVWSARTAFRSEVARDIKASDHYPAIATHLLDVELPIELPLSDVRLP